jgi:hypothetical protein
LKRFRFFNFHSVETLFMRRDLPLNRQSGHGGQ